MTERRLNLLVLWPTLALLGLGVVMVYSASAVFAGQRLGDATHFFLRQVVFALLGAGLLFLMWRLDYRVLRRACWPVVVALVVALVLVMIPGFGRAGGGAMRWIALGPVWLQPGELAKPIVVLYLATVLARRQEHERNGRSPGSIIWILAVPGLEMVLLLLEPDFGSAVIVGALTFMLLFVGGARISYLLLALLAAVPIVFHLIASSPYRMRRLLSFMDPWSHRYDIGYQVSESLISIGSGGVTGLGLGDGRQKLFFLPAAHTDFIFSIIAEELGFIGVLFIVSCFAAIVVAGTAIARRTATPFGRYLCLGMTALIGLQASINMAVTLGLVPTKGLTLPLVSYGGSSLLASCAILGVLLSIDATNPGIEAARRAAAERPSDRLRLGGRA